MKRRIVKRKSKKQFSMTDIGGPLMPGGEIEKERLLSSTQKGSLPRQSRKKIVQPADFGQTFEIGDVGETIPSEPYTSGSVEKRLHIDEVNIGRKTLGKPPIAAEEAKGSAAEVSGGMEDLTGKVEESSIIEQIGEPRKAPEPVQRRYTKKESVRGELPSSATAKTRDAMDRLIAWERKRREAIESTEGGEERFPRVAGYSGRTRAEILADEAKNVDIVSREGDSYAGDRKLFDDASRRIRELESDYHILVAKRNREKDGSDKWLEFQEKINQNRKEFDEQSSAKVRYNEQMTVSSSRLRSAERDLGSIRDEKASWQRYKTLGERKWRDEYSRYARVTKDLYQRGKGLQEMGGTISGPGISDNLTKMLASPTPGAAKMGENWRNMFGGGVGYREGRTVTDVVGYGGSPTGWTQMFGKVTSVSGNRMAGIIQPIASRQGAPALQFSMTTPVRRIGIGDVSAAGIPTFRADAVTAPASPQAMAPSQYSQVQGTPSWQKARKVIRRKKGVVYGGAMIRGSMRLEMGKSAVGIGPKAFASGIAPIGSAKLTANPVLMPKMHGLSTPKMTGIEFGKASVGINTGAMKQFTVKQCDAMIKGTKKKKKKRGG